MHFAFLDTHHVLLTRGVFLVSRLANYYHDDSRLLAFGFFGVNYQAPSPADFDAKELEKVLGYWFFFSEDEDAGKIMHEHVSPFGYV